MDTLPVAVEAIEDIYPLSPMQQGMLFHSLYEQGCGDYINQMQVPVAGLDVERFRAAWQAALESHAILRSAFFWGEAFETPVQVVLRDLRIEVVELDAPASDATLEQLAERERSRGFDLVRPPLLRLLLVRTGAASHHLIYTSHHILMDGWSNARLLGEVLQRYAGETPKLPAGGYRDYIAWLQRQDRSASEHYWKQQLARLEASTRLAHTLPAGAADGAAHAEFACMLDGPATQRLLHFARHRQVTLNTLVQAAWLLLLQRYTGHPVVAFGATVAGRPTDLPGVEEQVGLFINTLPVIAAPRAEQALGDWLVMLQAQNLELREHEHTPLYDIQRWAGQGGEALFDSILVFENYPVSEALEQAPSGLRFGEVLSREQTNYPLTLGVNLGEQLSLHFDYVPALFSAEHIQRLAAQLLSLLQRFEEAAGRPLGTLPILADDELSALLASNAPCPYPVEPFVHQRIARLAREDGSHTTLIFDGRHHSRSEIEARANRLAHALIDEGVGPEVRVAVGLPRGDTLLVALLAVLKTGGVYVPLDINYPRERLAFLLEDSGSALLLSLSGTAESLPAPRGGRVLLLDELDLDAWPAHEPQVGLHPENLAYVIYTSGSTGRPKGVAVAHGPLAMHCQAIGERYEMSEADCELHFMSFAFDGAHERWLTALTHGSSLLLRDDELWTAERTYREMQHHGVTVAAFPPAYLQQLAEHAEHEGNPPAVRIYCFGGDAVPRASYERARAALSPDFIINGYGPTETVVTPLIWKAGRGEECEAAYAPIGSRIGDRSAYVLDADLNPLPQGITGELYLGGHGLARGYLDRPGMSAERFIADPFTRGGRLYRTGDLVRQRPDGTFEYQGRVDNQVKIRGFRIELGEIEACLLACDPVREAVVVVRQGASGRQLAAYVTLNCPPENGLRERLLEELGQRLPGYMVPASLMLLEQLPLTPNGKIDRKALPEPLPSQRGEHYVAPGNEVERRLLEIWQAALKLERIGTCDNFFELGGDSIISIQVVSRARAAGIHFTPKELFQHQTVQGLARVARTGAAAQVDQGPVRGETPLLPFQRLFFGQAIPNRQHWNQSLLLQPRQALDAEALEAALQALVEHHDALRLRFTEVDGQWRAEHAGITGEALLWQAEAENGGEVEALCDEAQRSLDLARGPLLRALLVKVADGSQRLLLAIHHLVVDGVSWRILLEDLQQAYEQRLAGQALQLPAKTSAFKAWAERLGEYAQGPQMQGELDYWRQQLVDAPADLPCRDSQGSLEIRHARSVRTHLDSELTRRLLQEAPAAYRTQVNDLLLTALARVICRWSGDSSVLVQLEGHGREPLFDDIDLSRSVGWFTSLFPVRLTPTADLGESLKAIKEQLRGLPNKGLGYGLLRYLAGPENAASLASLPQARITFNYLGRFDGQFDEAALLAPARESAGLEMDAGAPLGNWLSINGQVYDGELSLDWAFSERMFDFEPMQQLADAYAAELAELVGYCADPAHRGVTPSDFPLAGLSQAQLDTLPVAVEAIEDIYPLSPMQQGMLFHSLSDEGDGFYVNQVCMSVEGLDVERFQAAWQDAVNRHDILRTTFHWQGLGDPLQIVHRRARMDIRYLDRRAGDASEQGLVAIGREELERGFDLACLPLQRLVLVRTSESSHHLIWTSHHILMDGWSSSRLFGEVMQHYSQGRVEGAQARYRDFVAWLQRQDRGTLEGFWRERLASLDEPCSLSQASYPRPEPGQQGHEALYTHWGRERTGQLLQCCRQQGITPNTLVQAAWLLLLQRYTGQRSVIFGATVAGRPESLRGADDMLGLFINTLPVIQEIDPQGRLDQWLARLQSYNLDLREHAHAPLADVQRWSGQSGQMLFDSIIVFENYPIDARLQAEQSHEGPRFGASSNRDVTNFPMDLAVHLGEELSIEYLFLRNRFSREAVEGIRRTLEATLEAMLRTPRACLGNLQRLAKVDHDAMSTWGREPAPRHRRLCVSALIAERAALQPEATALVCSGARLSYAELERCAERLARRLIAQGVGPETKVGIALERSLSMPVALLAVLKAGGAYVPLDLDYPAERLAFMVEDSGMRLLIGRADVRERLALPSGLPLLDPEQDEDSPAPVAIATAPAENNLAYLIYTSGSTGTPKGVAVTRGPLTMHCQAIIELYEMVPGTRELHFMSFAFDGAHERWLSLLVSGGTLIMRDDELWTPERTFQVLGEQRVDIACFPPAYLKQLAEYAEGSQLPPPPVRIYCFGGDAVAEKALEQVAEALRPQYFVNGYGPTETVVTPMLWKVPRGVPCEAPYAPIGRVVGQRSLWVMDNDMNLLPMGLAGELYIGGHGLARGYNARPALTAERFVPDPNGEPGSRLYRTGDLVRVRADGIMDYLGRVDHQVKVRGFRIELGEIEACLRRQTGVGEALVIARESPSGKQLIGYVACNEPCAGERLRAALRESLPEYMVPAQVVCLERLPLTPNGKLDRKALPEPEIQAGDYVAPRNEEEALLAEVWAQVLQVERVGIHDNFFELGGDSILSLQVVSRLRNHPRLQLEVKLRDLMRYQTIAGLCERNAVNQAAATEAVGKVGEGAFPLLPIQEWFFAQRMPEPGHFNQALLLRSRQALDVEALELALRDMLRHHDSLRLRFVQQGSTWQQSYGPMPPEDQALLWLEQAADEEALEALANQAQCSLDLERGPLLRGLYVTMAGGDVRLLLAVHHLAIDAVSWRVLLEDLQAAYEARCARREAQLPVRSSSYREWAEGLAAKAGELREQELAYWLAALGGPGSEFPCDNPRGRNQVRHQAFVAMKLSKEHTELLLKQAPRAYQAQINDLLLTALGRVLCRWSGSTSARVQLEGHGREELCESLDLSRTLGWFTSLYPVCLSPNLEDDLAGAVTAVRRQLEQVPNKGVGYGVLRYMAGEATASLLGALPQARVTFNYLGQFDQTFDESALLVPAKESSGEAYSLEAPLGNWLEVVGQVFDARLSFRCLYSTRLYRPATMERFMGAFQAELEHLVEQLPA
nr:non-ribosomal peptide synthetase [Pseudomonas delhiensis]